MYRNHTIGVVVPAYNEQGFVGDVIESVPDYADRIYAVDDASTDGTWDEIKRTALRINQRDDEHDDGLYADGAGTSSASEPTSIPESAVEADPQTTREDILSGGRVVPIQHGDNRGAGAAIKTGYLRALEDDVDIVTVLDADGQMDPNIMDRFLDPIVEGKAEYTKGTRLLSREYRREMPQFRLFGNFVLTFLTKIASGYWKMTDPQNGYTAISNRALREAQVEEMYEYYGYCNDLLVKLNAQNVRIADVGMQAVYGDEQSSIDYGEYIRNVSWMLFTNWLWRLKTKYLVVDFHPLALFYGLGVTTAGVGLVGLLFTAWALFTSASAVMTGLLSTLLLAVGGISILLAMTFDMLDNEHLEVQIA